MNKDRSLQRYKHQQSSFRMQHSRNKAQTEATGHYYEPTLAAILPKSSIEIKQEERPFWHRFVFNLNIQNDTLILISADSERSKWYVLVRLEFPNFFEPKKLFILFLWSFLDGPNSLTSCLGTLATTGPKATAIKHILYIKESCCQH